MLTNRRTFVGVAAAAAGTIALARSAGSAAAATSPDEATVTLTGDPLSPSIAVSPADGRDCYLDESTDATGGRVNRAHWTATSTPYRATLRSTTAWSVWVRRRVKSADGRNFDSKTIHQPAPTVAGVTVAAEQMSVAVSSAAPAGRYEVQVTGVNRTVTAAGSATPVLVQGLPGGSYSGTVTSVSPDGRRSAGTSFGPVTVPGRAAPSAAVMPTRNGSGPGATGLPVGWSPRTTVNGDTTVRTAGALYEDVRFNGWVDVQAAGVTFRRCEINGGPDGPSAYIGLLRVNNPANNGTLIEDCLIRPTVKSPAWNGIVGHRFVARRVLVLDVVDVFEVYGPSTDRASDIKVLVEGCFGGDFLYCSQRETPAGLGGWDGYTHNDWCQIQSGRNIELRYNVMSSLVGPSSQVSSDAPFPKSPGDPVLSNMVIKPNLGQIADIRIHHNWCYGGDFAFNLSNDSASGRVLSPRIGYIDDNRFQRMGTRGGYLRRAISMPSNAVCDTECNINSDDGSPVTVYRNG